MLNPEAMSNIVNAQVDKILKSSPHYDFFEDKRPEELKRFEICTRFINRTKEAVTKTMDFSEAASDTYFKSNTDKEILFYLGDTEYEMYYLRDNEFRNTGVIVEDFYLIKDGKEKISLRKFVYEDGGVNAHIIYSDIPEDDFRETKYVGDKRAIAEGERLIRELELASE